jgi:hypothetical protein
MLGIVIGLIGFFLIAIVSIGVWWVKRGEVQPPAAAAPIETPVAAPTPEPTATEAQPAEAKLGTIKLVAIEPKQGVTFSVDGKPLAAGVMTIDRPEPGKVRLLSATAEGYQADVYRIDDATPDELEVMLLKKQEAPAGPTPAPAPAPVAPGPAKPAEKKPSAIKPDIPDNPF